MVLLKTANYRVALSTLLEVMRIKHNLVSDEDVDFITQVFDRIVLIKWANNHIISEDDEMVFINDVAHVINLGVVEFAYCTLKDTEQLQMVCILSNWVKRQVKEEESVWM